MAALVSHRYTKPLTPEFQAAADKLATQQAELDAHMRARKLDQARTHVQEPKSLPVMHFKSVRPFICNAVCDSASLV